MQVSLTVKLIKHFKSQRETREGGELNKHYLAAQRYVSHPTLVTSTLHNTKDNTANTHNYTTQSTTLQTHTMCHLTTENTVAYK